MSPPEGVNTLTGRLATFEGPRRLTKRRASSTRKKGPNSHEWPHQNPSAEQLAKAGFFYQPTSASNDNVQCFVCQSQIDGWDPEDVPAVEHYTLASHCAWAINQFINHKMSEGERVDEDPLGETLLEARRATFMDSWPHEHKKGWKPKIKKMIEAGWCFDPSPDNEDATMCCYCNLSLDGWEPKDDPKVEHRKRSPDCPFFKLVDEFAASRKKRGKSARGSKASTKSRVSTQSNATAITNDQSSRLSVGTAAAEDDTVLTNTTSISTTSKGGRKRGAAKTATQGTRKGPGRGKKATNTSVSHIDETINDATVAAEETVPPPARATRARKRNTAQSTTHNESTIETIEPPRRTARGRPAKTTRTKSRLSDDESQLHSELQDAIQRLPPEDHSKPTRGTKRTSDGTAKAGTSSIMILEDPPPPVKRSTLTKNTRAKKATKRTTRTKETQSSQVDVDMVDAPEESVRPALSTNTTRKDRIAKSLSPSKSPTPFKSVEPEVEKLPTSEPNYEEDFDDDVEIHDTVLEDFPVPPSSAARPARSSPQQTTQPTPPKAKATPSPSPQSSDAENIPPSARPPTHPASVQKIQESSIRKPLGELASTPVVSPSKRNMIVGGLNSSQPWDAIDLETIFLFAQDEEREFRKLHGFSTDTLDQENLNSKDPKRVDDAISRVKASLSVEEKAMTVEQWIRYNAGRGEERLRAECERMVSVFEEQGNRALRAIEGIECVFP